MLNCDEQSQPVIFIPREVCDSDIFEDESQTPQVRKHDSASKSNSDQLRTQPVSFQELHLEKKVRFECAHRLENDSESSEEDVPLNDKELIDAVVTSLLDRDNWEYFSIGDHVRISASHIVRICELVKPILIEQGALLKLGEENEQFKIFGDIHGQYDDMVQLLSAASAEKSISNKYLFLGDYVDRGDHSFEVIISLIAWKILCPHEVYLLRGNHEIASINRKYGFFSELLLMYELEIAEEVFDAINDVFDCLPLAAILYEQFFCVHGGLSENLNNADELADVTLPCTVPAQGAMINDILWSDPDINDEVKYWKPNPKRAAMFGSDAVREFLEKNDLKGVIRAHQVAEKGYWTACDNQVLCVFSAANYCGRTNLSAVLTVRDDKMFISQFEKDFEGALTQIDPDASCEPEDSEFERSTAVQAEIVSPALPRT